MDALHETSLWCFLIYRLFHTFSFQKKNVSVTAKTIILPEYKVLCWLPVELFCKYWWF